MAHSHDIDVRLERIQASRKRWSSRLSRAVNAIKKLEAQERRLLKLKASKPLPVIETDHMSEAQFAKFAVARDKEQKQLAPPKPKVSEVTEVTELTSAGGFGIALDDDALDVRNQPWVKNPADDAAKAEIESKRAEHKKAKAVGAKARRKAERSGETKRMPLQGKAALAAIRGQ